MMSPGLALFLYGVSSIPGEGGIGHAKVLIPGFIGLALMVAFVLYSFRPKHPLLDLRLFKQPQPHRLGHHDVHLRGVVLRWPAARAAVPPAGPG